VIDENSFTPMKASSVKNVHERLGAVGTVLRGKLVALEIADAFPRISGPHQKKSTLQSSLLLPLIILYI